MKVPTVKWKDFAFQTRRTAEWESYAVLFKDLWPLISAGQGGTGGWEEGRDLFTVMFPVQAYESMSVAATGLSGAEGSLMVQTPIRNEGYFPSA